MAIPVVKKPTVIEGQLSALATRGRFNRLIDR